LYTTPHDGDGVDIGCCHDSKHFWDPWSLFAHIEKAYEMEIFSFSPKHIPTPDMIWSHAQNVTPTNTPSAIPIPYSTSNP